MLQKLDDSQRLKWPDDETWLSLFEPMFSEDASLADTAARLWHHLIEEIKNGREGATRARQCLEDALKLTFPFTEAHKACRTLFEMSLTGDLAPENEPLCILKGAIERAQTRTRRKR